MSETTSTSTLAAGEKVEAVATVSMKIEQIDGYEFRIRFDNEKLTPLIVDESEPLGQDRGPNPSRLLVAAIGDCLTASLFFCLSKRRIPITRIDTDVSAEMVRNEQKRLRVGKVSVTLRPQMADPSQLQKCLETFEDFCVVTQSVRRGIDVDVKVEPVTG
jgi:uncharacterized OsmC-like protein